jgi:hypothetical protein
VRESTRRYVVLLAILALCPIAATGAIAMAFGLRTTWTEWQPTPTQSATLPFPTIETSTPTRHPTLTSTLIPTSPPTATPTSTPTFTPTPTPTPTPRVVTLQVQALGRLETARFMMQSIVDRQRVPENIWESVFGTEQLLLVAEGEVVAGFDMTSVRKQDIVVQGDRVQITLPAPIVLYSRVDNNKTYIYERKTGLFRKPDKDMESEARQLAEQAMVEHALEGNILEQAQANGRLQIEAFLRSLGFTEVVITIRPEGS